MKMEKATITFVLALVSLATTLLITGSGACTVVQPTTQSAACQQASTGQTMYELCMKTLNAEPPNSDLSVYALAAAEAAAMSYEATMQVVDQLLQDPSLRGDLRDACSACMEYYGTARNRVGGVADRLRGCSFAGLSQEYVEAVAAVDECASKVLPVGSSTPLYGKILADRDRSMLAFRLGSLIVN